MDKQARLDELKLIAIARGGKLLSTVYKNSKEKMLWICGKEHPFNACAGNVRNKSSWCRKCSVQIRSNKQKLDISILREIAIKRGGKLLSTEYKNGKGELQWICGKGHRWNASAGSVKNKKSWCPECSGNKKLDISIFQKIAIERGGKLLSTEYKNIMEKLLWECGKGHQWKARAHNIKNRGNWCLKCSGSKKLDISILQQIAIERGGKLLSIEYKNCKEDLLWECGKGHQWYACAGNVKNKTWCLECSGCKKLDISILEKIAIEKEGKLLSTEYKDNKEKLLWECEKGHQWNACANEVKNRKRWCPYCNNYRSENTAREIFEEFIQCEFPNCKPKWLNGLQLDGYNEPHKIAFEYQGKQHYKYNPHFHRTPDAFEKQKERDKIKAKICAERKIDLILIPYQYNYTNKEKMKEYILEELKNKGIIILEL